MPQQIISAFGFGFIIFASILFAVILLREFLEKVTDWEQNTIIVIEISAFIYCYFFITVALIMALLLRR